MADNTTETTLDSCKGPFAQAHDFEYKNPGNIKYEVTDNHYYVKVGEQYYSVGLTTPDEGGPYILTQPASPEQVAAARCAGKDVYESIAELNEAVKEYGDINPIYGLANKALEYVVHDNQPDTPTIETTLVR